MRFLVDESCDVALGNALIHAGHDVLEVIKKRCGADDEWVVNLAVSENLILPNNSIYSISGIGRLNVRRR